jgi:hypothetical protein
MGLQIAIAYDAVTEAELLTMGFQKKEVYVKNAPFHVPVPEGKTISEHEKTLGDREFFSMKRPPLQFVTTSFWGAGNGP